ncbi:MAG TPA: hypothetical protein VHT05_09575 [Candidatus Elarobacter sp.]|nr:hypothetical protein [Candidatus Elarobacter sp.]
MNGIVAGAIAGAAGTLALDVASYADMALRGRAASDMPSEVVRRLAERAGIASLAAPPDRTDPATKNRRGALGALSGYAVGLSIGIVYGCARAAGAAIPVELAGVLLGALAMAASDVPAVKLGATDLAQWDGAAWLSDAVPHLAYGVVTAAVAEALIESGG